MPHYVRERSAVIRGNGIVSLQPLQAAPSLTYSLSNQALLFPARSWNAPGRPIVLNTLNTALFLPSPAPWGRRNRSRPSKPASARPTVSRVRRWYRRACWASINTCRWHRPSSRKVRSAPSTPSAAGSRSPDPPVHRGESTFPDTHQGGLIALRLPMVLWAA